MMFLLPFWALNVSVALLSMEGQKALRFHQKYLHLCSEDERRSVSPLSCVMCPHLMFPYLVCFLSLVNVIIS